jgi:hypothetical protein
VNHPVQQQGQTMAMVALPAVGRCSFAQWKEAALLIRATWPGQVFPDLTVEEKAENERLKRECLARLDEFAAKKALVPDDEFQRFAARRALRRQELRRMGETLAERERELAARRSETG